MAQAKAQSKDFDPEKEHDIREVGKGAGAQPDLGLDIEVDGLKLKMA